MKKMEISFVSLLLLGVFSGSAFAATCPNADAIKEKKVNDGYIFTTDDGWESGVIKWTGKIKDLFMSTLL